MSLFYKKIGVQLVIKSICALFVFLFQLTLWGQLGQSYGMDCSRDLSRIVREYIKQHIAPVYESHDTEMPRSCPLIKERDFFHDHEAHKTEDSYAKWLCEYCGKAFYAENFLDNHLQNKHAHHLYTGPDAVCLADYCDIFRCDVISGRVEPTFWDTALCIEDDMSDLITKCNKVFSTCNPRGVSTNKSSVIMNKTKGMVCSSLTCNKFWFTGKIEPEQWIMLLKTFCTVMLIASMFVYYFIAYHHFCTDSFQQGGPRERYQPYKRDLDKIPRKKVRKRAKQNDWT